MSTKIMEMSKKINTEYSDPFSTKEIVALARLARGNYSLVEDALVKHLQKQRKTWWKIWEPRYWVIDREAVINYIIDNRKDDLTYPCSDVEIQDEP